MASRATSKRMFMNRMKMYRVKLRTVGPRNSRRRYRSIRFMNSNLSGGNLVQQAGKEGFSS
jgi:hypothetical protein